MFRFTIRDVLWLTALVAMGVAWWLHVSRLTSSRKIWLNDIAIYLRETHGVKAEFDGKELSITDDRPPLGRRLQIPHEN
jgi:hypothetical protein